MSCGTTRFPELAFSLLSTIFVAIPMFFLLCTCQSGEALPFFGSLLSSLGSSSSTTNGTSLLQLLLLEHLQDKVDNFAEVASIFG